MDAMCVGACAMEVSFDLYIAVWYVSSVVQRWHVVCGVDCDVMLVVVGGVCVVVV